MSYIKCFIIRGAIKLVIYFKDDKTLYVLNPS